MSVEAAPTEEVSHARRNHWLGVASGTLGQVGIGFLNPNLILVGMVYALTRTQWPALATFLVAIVAIINKGGALAPQLIVGGYLDPKPRKMPYFVGLIGVRAAAYLLLIASLWMLVEAPTAGALVFFFAAYLFVCMAGGSAQVVTMGLVGRLIPHYRLGRFLGLRSSLGWAMSSAVGLLVIQPVLGEVRFPLNYLVLVSAGAAIALLSMAVFALAVEEDGPRARRAAGLRESLRRGLRWLREDHNYRCYFWLRVAFRVNFLGLVFFIPYGAERLHPEGGAQAIALLGGLMVAINVGSRMLSGLLLGRFIDHHGFKRVLVLTGIGFTLSPLLALLAPELPETFRIALPRTAITLTLPMLVYFLALAALGMTTQGSVIGGQQFLICSAPPHRRISYLGFLNSVTSPLTLLPLAGAWLASTAGISAVFFVVTGGGLLYLFSALRMKPVRIVADPARGVSEACPLSDN